MQKTKDISKLDIDWQVQRVFLKQVPFCDKLKLAEEYLFKNYNRADKERILNYLEGLSFSYHKDSESREKALQLYRKLEGWEVTDENRCSQDFTKYSDGVLKLILEDLMSRAMKWLKKGYRHMELIHFIKQLCIYLKDHGTYSKLNAQVLESCKIKNTHKFFF